MIYYCRFVPKNTTVKAIDGEFDFNSGVNLKEEFPILRMYYPPINIKPTNKTPLHKKFIKNFKKLF